MQAKYERRTALALPVSRAPSTGSSEPICMLGGRSFSHHGWPYSRGRTRPFPLPLTRTGRRRVNICIQGKLGRRNFVCASSFRHGLSKCFETRPEKRTALDLRIIAGKAQRFANCRRLNCNDHVCKQMRQQKLTSYI